MAAFLGASPGEIFFTSGGTEAINLAIKGFYEANRDRGSRIVSTPVESAAVLRSLDWLQGQGAEIIWLPVDREGHPDLSALTELLTSGTILTCIQWANGEIGTIQPIPQIAQICEEAGVALFCDATASAGWVPINLRQTPIPLLAIHFRGCGGPVGVGALYKREGIAVRPQIHGGPQEKGLRAGTENLPGIVGAGKAAELAAETLAASAPRLRLLSQKLWSEICSEIPDLQWHGSPIGEGRLPHHLSWSAEGAEGEAQVLACDLKGLAIAAGPSCIAKSLRGSQVLRSLGLSQRLAMTAVQVTMRKEISEADLEYFCRVYTKVVDRLRSMSPTWHTGKGQPLPGHSAGETSR